MRRTASVLAAFAIIMMAYAPVYAAGQAAEDHLCCLRQLRQAALVEHSKEHCAGMAAHEAAPTPPIAQLHALSHSCERCVAAASAQIVPLASSDLRFAQPPVAIVTSTHSALSHSSNDLCENLERGPPSHLAA